jgi:hypothetical protein
MQEPRTERWAAHGRDERESTMSQGMFDPDLLKPGPSPGSNGDVEPSPGDDHLSEFLEDTLGSVLRSARESAADLMEKARRASEEEAAISRGLREDAQREVDRMAAWSLQVEPLVQAVYEKAATIRDRIEEAPGRVAEALSQIRDALADMDELMARLTDALRPQSGGHDGDNGPSGPNGGSRSDGPVDQAPAEPVREEVERSPSADAPDRVPDAMTEGPEPVETPAMSLVEEGASEPAADEGPAGLEAALERERVDPTSIEDAVSPPTPMVSSTSTWVDPPGDDISMSGGDAPIAEAEADARGEADPPDADDALRSASTQLRRVAEIDWHDLPSASSG